MSSVQDFISDKDREFHVLKRLESAVAIDQDQEHTVNINTENEKIRSLFLSGIRPIAGRLRFTKREFDNKKGWGPNKWGKIEADLFYIIRRRKHPRFGDEKLISKKYRR